MVESSTTTVSTFSTPPAKYEPSSTNSSSGVVVTPSTAFTSGDTVEPPSNTTQSSPVPRLNVFVTLAPLRSTKQLCESRMPRTAATVEPSRIAQPEASMGPTALLSYVVHDVAPVHAGHTHSLTSFDAPHVAAGTPRNGAAPCASLHDVHETNGRLMSSDDGAVGSIVGTRVGDGDGDAVGVTVGAIVGACVGDADGEAVGVAVGAAVIT
mmetsp:Transcript_11044/g.26664  ORF Transcript_11044/g.26664 Transcript_11044/m.26664 type:complete len:210 (-) Transcript_11044:169-798(-)